MVGILILGNKRQQNVPRPFSQIYSTTSKKGGGGSGCQRMKIKDRYFPLFIDRPLHIARLGEFEEPSNNGRGIGATEQVLSARCLEISRLLITYTNQQNLVLLQTAAGRRAEFCCLFDNLCCSFAMIYKHNKACHQSINARFHPGSY